MKNAVAIRHFILSILILRRIIAVWRLRLILPPDDLAVEHARDECKNYAKDGVLLHHSIYFLFFNTAFLFTRHILSRK